MKEKKKIKASEVHCPYCYSKLKFIHELSTDWYGNLKYYSCSVCNERLVSQNSAEPCIAAPR